MQKINKKKLKKSFEKWFLFTIFVVSKSVVKLQDCL